MLRLNFSNFVLDCLHDSCFKYTFSPGNFVHVYQRRQASSTTEQRSEDEEPTEATVADQSVFSCPSEGCIKVYQRYSALEKHLSFGKCKLVPERESLLDKAKRSYQSKLVEGTSAQATVEGDVTVQLEAAILAEGWALKSSKKSTRFNEAQKRYLESKFMLGQETGHKLDPETVARDMRYARNDEGRRQFTVNEFLTAQQVQSFFSRRASRLRQVTTDDREAAEDSEAYDELRTLVLREVQLCHPIVYDTLNLCEINRKGKLNQLTVAMLRTVCEHFEMDVKEITYRRKAPYLSMLKELLESCHCFSEEK